MAGLPPVDILEDVALAWANAGLDVVECLRRCTTVTDFDVRAKTNASSIAVSPPPTTATSISLNKKPSQVAHDDTPPPLYVLSPSTPNHLLSAPVATINECAEMFASGVSTRKGLCDRSMFETLCG